MFEKIYEIVYDELGISKKQILMSSRKKKYVTARCLFTILCIKSGISYSKISKEIKRDHTTVIHQYESRKDDKLINNILFNNNDSIESIKIGVFKLEPKRLRFVGIPNRNKAYKSLYELHGGKCMVCSFDEVVEVHHINPKYLGGTDELSNLALLCPNHHALADRGMLIIKDKVINQEIVYPQA